MFSPTLLLFVILIATILMFLFGRWRHDMVAVAALLVCCAAGVISPADAFSGFSHPAVVTVACVLVLSYALQQTGAVDVLAKRLLPSDASPTVSITALAALAALLSSFMNNVGALALLMPIALQMAGRLGIPHGRVLMPLAFATMFGGMTTLIGTPSNLVVSSFRTYDGHNGFAMFDFSPVGVVVAVIGVLFLGLIGWRLVPVRERQDSDSFETGAYLTEARVPDESKAIDMTLGEAEEALADAEAQILGLIRNGIRLNAPDATLVLRAGDVILLEADPATLAKTLETLELVFEEGKTPLEDSDNPETALPTTKAAGPGFKKMKVTTNVPSALNYLSLSYCRGPPCWAAVPRIFKCADVTVSIC
ncbi:SLC13 family permease [Paenalcaligenes niemegkensis]|uniref:SLC13 family permease n=1 Tax=Paenalcaligenes niemegkensis TaxID=2895469 RepID=UPI001EE99620|nr:SLC13 family permease [Paenalcaligenes niemegkensis]MCQ9618043.1 SLC13 family permease [Paenalcaligenes niemegkensis]